MKKKPNFYYVYLITNITSNKPYVGSRVSYSLEEPINDEYFGSSLFLDKEITEIGKENFKKEILGVYESKDLMRQKEIDYILEYNSLAPNGYNRHLPPTKFNTNGVSVYEIWELKYGKEEADKRHIEFKRKESESQSGEKNSFYGKKHSKETKDKIATKQKERLKNGDYSEAHKKAGKTMRERGSVKGSKNGMFGRIWITNVKLKESKIIEQIELKNYIKDGWTKGRKQYKIQRT